MDFMLWLIVWSLSLLGVGLLGLTLHYRHQLRIRDGLVPAVERVNG